MDTNLPGDLILRDILTRASPETVAISRTVCKEWNEATHQWSFANKFHRTKKIVSGFFVQDYSLQKGYESNFFSTNADADADADADAEEQENNPNPSLSFLPGKLKIEAATKQGLLLCWRYDAVNPWVEYVLCKPTTKQWIEIPKPRPHHNTVKIAMTLQSSNPLDLQYKIARFTRGRFSPPGENLRCEIFDSWAWSWRSLPESLRLPRENDIFLTKPVVSVGRFFYALMTRRRLFAFDWESENWKAMALPQAPAPGEEPERLQIVEYEGKLGLFRWTNLSKSMELWVYELAGGRTRAWKMRKVVDMECLIEEGYFSAITPVAMSCSDVTVFSTFLELVFYRFGSGDEDASKNRVLKAVKCPQWDFMGELFRMESDEEFVDLAAAREKSTFIHALGELAATTSSDPHRSRRRSCYVIGRRCFSFFAVSFPFIYVVIVLFIYYHIKS